MDDTNFDLGFYLSHNEGKQNSDSRSSSPAEAAGTSSVATGAEADAEQSDDISDELESRLDDMIQAAQMHPRSLQVGTPPTSYWYFTSLISWWHWNQFLLVWSAPKRIRFTSLELRLFIINMYILSRSWRPLSKWPSLWPEYWHWVALSLDLGFYHFSTSFLQYFPSPSFTCVLNSPNIIDSVTLKATATLENDKASPPTSITLKRTTKREKNGKPLKNEAPNRPEGFQLSDGEENSYCSVRCAMLYGKRLLSDKVFMCVLCNVRGPPAW